MSVLTEDSQAAVSKKTDDVLSDPEEEYDGLRAKIFPQRLMEILSDERNTDAITWLPHGMAFSIRNRKLFAEKVMPKFFSRKSKYSSFTRKLNRWNFVRISSGPELGAYYHEFFLRDRPQLATQMFCKNARAKLAMAAVAESQGTTQEQPSSPIAYAHLNSTSVPHQSLPQQMSSVNTLALQKTPFEEQLGKEQQNKKRMVKSKLLEHKSLCQYQLPVDHTKRVMLEAMIASGGYGPMIQQPITPYMLQAQLALQQQQSQAAKLIKIQEIMALKWQRQGSAAFSSIFNHSFSK